MPEVCAFSYSGRLLDGRARAPQFWLLGATALALVTVDVATAYAQVAEVVVTARKRDENIQNIPVAVTAISGAVVEKFNLTTVEDVANRTPQLIISRGSSGSGADITMRGIGSSSENIGIEQSVSVNVDGVYYGQGRAIDEGVFDVANVQVLKGPQALFYGKNATAGAVAIQTNDPTPQPAASLTAGYEFNAEEPYVEGVASGPVTDRFGLRLAFHYSDQQNGYLRNTATEQTYNTYDVATGNSNSGPTARPTSFLGGAKDALVRLTAKWEPTDRLTITVKGTFDDHRTNNNADNSVVVYCPLGYPQSEATLTNKNTCGRQFAAAQPAFPLEIANVPGSLEGKAGGQDFEHYRDGNAYLKINYEGDAVTLTSTTGYQRLFNEWGDNQNFTGAASVYGAERFDWDQFSTEERFNTKFKGPINFSGGVYFQTTDLDFRQDVDFAGAQNTAAPAIDEFVAYNKLSRTVGHTYAVFGQGIWDIVPDLELTAGARYTHELKSSFFRQPYVNPTLSFLFVQYDPTNPATAVSAKQTFDNVSPEVTLTWKPYSNVTLYGAYKTGYKSGGFSNSAILSTGTLPGDLQFKPETAEGFEAGLKTTVLDRQLRVDADVFDFTYSNLQVDFFNTPTFNYVTLNAASANTYGVEATVDYSPRAAPGLNLHFDGAYDNSRYEHFTAPCSPAGITYEQGCNLARVVIAGTGAYTFSPNCGTAANPCNFMNVDGRPTALSPKWTAVVGGDYERAINSAYKLGLSVDARFSSAYVASPFPSDVALGIDRQKSYAVLDAALTLASLNHHWTFSVIGKNLTNTFIELGTAGLPLSGGATGCKTAICGAQLVSDQAATVANPRTVAIQVKYAY
jgi:outer membrane receptor protein involved in Fe transport